MSQSNNSYSADRVFFTSDTHFGHASIIGFCKRPYQSVEEMNDKLVEQWNSVVHSGDTVFHLGDFCFGGLPLWEAIRDRLNGDIHLILGNHDLRSVNANSYRMRKMFESVSMQRLIKVNGQLIYLNHYPFLCWGGDSRQQVWQLYGHVHSGPLSTSQDLPRLKVCYPTQYDVGVDNNNYTPVSGTDIINIIKQQCQQ